MHYGWISPEARLYTALAHVEFLKQSLGNRHSDARALLYVSPSFIARAGVDAMERVLPRYRDGAFGARQHPTGSRGTMEGSIFHPGKKSRQLPIRDDRLP